MAGGGSEYELGRGKEGEEEGEGQGLCREMQEVGERGGRGGRGGESGGGRRKRRLKSRRSVVDVLVLLVGGGSCAAGRFPVATAAFLERVHGCCVFEWVASLICGLAVVGWGGRGIGRK